MKYDKNMNEIMQQMHQYFLYTHKLQTYQTNMATSPLPLLSRCIDAV